MQPSLQWKSRMLPVRIVELHVTVSNIKILIIEHKCFHGEFMSPETIKPT
jgi:hypothetical protein